MTLAVQCAARDAARWDVLARIESEQDGAAEAAQNELQRLPEQAG